MKLRFAILSLALALALSASAQSLDDAGELWWGGAVATGGRQPYTERMEPFDQASRYSNNQVSGLFVSSLGRYVWSNEPMIFSVDESGFRLEPAQEPVSAGTTLRDAYMAACREHFPPTGTLPDTLFFTLPQWNTWIELQYNQNQEDILKYAHAIVDNRMQPGVLMIDDNWQKYYGNFEFKPERFPDPKGMVDELHEMGFRVMLWVCPFVSPDSAEYRDLSAKGYLLRDVIGWWNGVSACYDMTKPEAAAHFTAQLRGMQERYGIDGFKLDAGDPNFYYPAFGNKSVEHTKAFLKIGLEFPFNEYRAGWQMGGTPLVMRLGDKHHSWNALQSLVPEMVAAGLMGHAYTCPDMIGGGMAASFLPGAVINEALVVRSAQLHAMMPMMQFSVAPWRVLSEENFAIVKSAAELHRRFSPYIMECARHAADTGEPIVRHMEYEFPGQGLADCKDQYMLGTRWLVAPVVTADNSREVRLPKGRWRDDRGVIHKGGRTITVDVPMERIVYFEKL